MGVPAVYGWLGVIGLLIGFIILVRYWIRKSVSTEAELERVTRARLEVERIAEEYKRVADIRARPLGDGTILRDVDKSSKPSHPAGDREAGIRPLLD